MTSVSVERWVVEGRELKCRNKPSRALPVVIPLNPDPAVDNTDAILSAIAAVTDGTTGAPNTVRLPPGRYRVDGTVNISGRNYLNIDGGGVFEQWTPLDGVEVGVVTAQGTSNRAHWRLSGCHNLVLSGIHVEGAHVGERDVSSGMFGLYLEKTAFEHAFAVQGASSNITIQDCSFEGNGGDGLYVGGTGAPNINITLRRITGSYPGRQSLGIVLVDGLLCEDVNIQWGGRSGLDVEPNHDSHLVHNAIFRRMDIGSKFYPYIVGGEEPLRGGEVKPGIVNKREHILIEDCVARNSASSHTAFLVNRSGVDLTIRRHTDMRQRSVNGVSAAGWDGFVIEDSRITSGPATPITCGVQLKDCVGTLRITNCNFNGLTANGGADLLYELVGTTPDTVIHSGNVWNMGLGSD